ncbi:MAG: electron transfer flavoprotein subunit beta/FixA family protein, partial [Bacillota bacterium]|nr:electron transfer flavoprotein subunit beta/FixA family protein [Bacillota bacterium]
MRIVVCIKQVPGTNQVHLDPDTRTIIREARHAVINPYDSFAIELAVQLKEITGAETIALSMGIPATEKLLRDALSRGIDQAVLLTDRIFAGADTWATANTLAAAVCKIGAVDLILCGKMAIDGDTAQTGPELAECLNFVPVTDVTEILSVAHDRLIVRHNIDGGY